MSGTHPDEVAFLAAIAAAPDDALPRLVFADWLEERNDQRATWVRDADIWEWMKPDAHDPVPGILIAMREGERFQSPRRDWDAAASGGNALRKLGAAVVDPVREWCRANPDFRLDFAIQEFVETHPPAELRSVPSLQAELDKSDWVEVWLAVIDLGFHGPGAAPAVAALMEIDGWNRWPELLDSYEDYLRPVENATNRTLAKIGPAAKEAVPWLAANLWVYEDSAGEALKQLEADPDLVVKHMNDDDYWEVESGYSQIIEWTGDPVSLLTRTAQNYEGRKATAAINLLAEMGARASAALPTLTELRDTRTGWDAEQVRAYARQAIEAIQGRT